MYLFSHFKLFVSRCTSVPPEFNSFFHSATKDGGHVTCLRSAADGAAINLELAKNAQEVAASEINEN